MQRITTEAGAVAGRRSVRDPGVVELRGIPYAAPPFGAGRFRAPRPAASWDGVRDCTAFGPVAPQSAELPGSPGWSRGDEDILSLNIWTPGGGGDRLPVLVWIHGGAYVFGSSAQPDFDGTALCRHGLVVVTLNYRLGFEGFGHVPPTGGGETCPDNRGLLDQIAALRWVRDNIAAFGGDPDRVTVAGQSSGATSVACRAVMGPLLEAYRALMPDASVNDLYLAVYGDLLFGEYSSRLAESHARAGAAPTSPASSGSATAGEAGQGLALCGHPVRLRHRGGRERPLPHRRTSCRRRPRTGGADDAGMGGFRHHRGPGLAAGHLRRRTDLGRRTGGRPGPVGRVPDALA